ncbi:hypothetical protein [Bacillus pseudomycoides]|uniref:hypothetical protein n=1 Tax=Bacillus pseudomycoides TaxID=64104 RepID=UPI00059D6E12|nr:hypothetical protein [Bacillus pseudomycoides]
MIRYLKFSLQFVVLCIVLTLLFDMIGWFIFKKNKSKIKQLSSRSLWQDGLYTYFDTRLPQKHHNTTALILNK